tara:strand:+ start:497 stop:1420 length:924 start_codon:yes stop_codon:yes gene_type:complete
MNLFSFTNKITKNFAIIVVSASIISVINPTLFVWFSGDLITYGLGFIMLSMGLSLDTSDFYQVFKTPTWVLLGLSLQFTIMPFLGWFLAEIFNLPTFFAVGLILVSCCPGGTASNVIAYLAKANLALSVCMTTLSTMSAIFLTPFLTSFLSGSYIDVSAWGLFYSTVQVVLIPVSIGLVINRYLPKKTSVFSSFSPAFAVILIALIVASIIGQGKEIILSSGLNLLFSILILHILGFTLGYFISNYLFKNKSVSRTISIEVGMQNSGLGVVLAQQNFTNPMAAIPAAISSLIHSIYGSIYVYLVNRK